MAKPPKMIPLWHLYALKAILFGCPLKHLSNFVDLEYSAMFTPKKELLELVLLLTNKEQFGWTER